MKIAVAGMGYVGLSLAVLLAQHCDVVAVDVLPEKVEKINAGRSPIQDREIEELLASGKLRLRATLDARAAYRAADSVVIAAPTNYDPQRNYFDTSAVENVIGLAMEANPEAMLVIKSTVPVGFSQHIRAQMGVRNLLFSPEFLRESRALYDNLYPSRIIVGTDMEDARLVEKAREFAGLLREGARKKEVDTLIMGYTEAEAVKLFANTYLALRVSFFNELDTYAELKGLDARRIIEGVCLDPRIGTHYNNPSFGYGGYCLPKDTKQLKSSFHDIPENLITAVCQANHTKKGHVIKGILNKHPGTVGIYRLTAKSNSDNFRSSAVWGVMEGLSKEKQEIVIYEPLLGDAAEFMGYKVVHSFAEFKRSCDVIVANRVSSELSEVMYKVYTRDIFGRD